MIKVCSLQFLKDAIFKADVKTVDGFVLFNSGEKVTPEIILELYFKDIYVDEQILEILAVPETTSTEEVSELVLVSSVAEENLESVSASEIGGSESGGHFSREIVSSVMADGKTASGPRSVDVVDDEPDANDIKGPRAADIALEHSDSASKELYSNSSKMQGSLDAAVADGPVEEEDKALEFDEVLAKRIVDNSIKLGKILGFSESELKDVEKVAYYCYIGITDFKQSDLSKKGFRKMKLSASYFKLYRGNIVSDEIAESVKLCANNYESETFALDSKVPYHHLVSITSCYEDMLARNISKQEVLLKMLQMGGNRFNIFALHKFIHLMKDI